jgi:penicillin-binding protein 1A
MRAGAAGTGGNVILEAFKPGTAPPDSYSVIGLQDPNAPPPGPMGVSPEADRAVSRGGLY